jgi:hypothetical protein
LYLIDIPCLWRPLRPARSWNARAMRKIEPERA